MKGKTFTTAPALAVLGMLGLRAQQTVVLVSRTGMSLKQLDLLVGLHRRISLNLSKEATIG